MSMLFGSMRKSRSTSSSHSLPSPARLSEGCNAQLDISFMKQLAKEAKFKLTSRARQSFPSLKAERRI
ncbi:hypothetical protein CEXT_405621 [Caerostris extrusa]|uniref:Uncharacterized protein n=1 Tax=Caerostris extrusa TaxID=172846 RepID=A0AAV4X7Q7_CAEEX|nr:hypothetical protein CEXT_405621 [Caerostris extrusa]